MLISISQKQFFLYYNNGVIWIDGSRKRKVLCCKKPIKILDVNVGNIVISKLVKTKN